MEAKHSKCAVCGKEFYVEEYCLYKWRHEGRICCSYSCMRVLEKEADKKRLDWIKKDYENYYNSKFDENILKRK